MKDPFPYTKTDRVSAELIGTPEPGTRIFVKTGPREGYTDWMNTILDVSSGRGFFTPGTVAEYVQVSRAAVHKRLKEGRLTAFQYAYTDKAEDDAESPDKSLVYVPVLECMAWEVEMKARRAKRKEKDNA